MSIRLHPELRPRINGAIVPVLNTPLCRAHGRFTFAFNLPIILYRYIFPSLQNPFFLISHIYLLLFLIIVLGLALDL